MEKPFFSFVVMEFILMEDFYRHELVLKAEVTFIAACSLSVAANYENDT